MAKRKQQEESKVEVVNDTGEDLDQPVDLVPNESEDEVPQPVDLETLHAYVGQLHDVVNSLEERIRDLEVLFANPGPVFDGTKVQGPPPSADYRPVEDNVPDYVPTNAGQVEDDDAEWYRA